MLCVVRACVCCGCGCVWLALLHMFNSVLCVGMCMGGSVATALA